MSILYKVTYRGPLPYHGEIDRAGTITVWYETLPQASLEVAASEKFVLFTVRVLGRKMVFVASTPIELLDTFAYLRRVGFSFSK